MIADQTAVIANFATIVAAAASIIVAVNRLLSRKIENEIKPVITALNEHMKEEEGTIQEIATRQRKIRKELKKHLDDDRVAFDRAAKALDDGQLHLIQQLKEIRANQ